jgi:amino acid transporter
VGEPEVSMNRPLVKRSWLLENPLGGGKILFNLLLYTLIFFAWPAYFRYLQEPDSVWRRLGMVLTPILGVISLFLVIRIFGKKPPPEPFDEMERRIVLEGSLFAYQVSVLVLMCAALLPAIFPSLSSNPFYRNVWIVLPVSKQVGFWIAKRRFA